MKFFKSDCNKLSINYFAMVVVGAILLPIIGYLLWRRNPDVMLENHLIENTQAGFLFFASLIYARRLLDNHNSIVIRLLYSGLALLTMSFFLREIDIDTLGSSAYWPIIEIILRLGILCLWLIFAAIMLSKLKKVFAARWTLIKSHHVILPFLGCLLYVFSWPFDKMMFSLDPSVSMMFEENLQLVACFLLFSASLLREKEEERGFHRVCGSISTPVKPVG